MGRARRRQGGALAGPLVVTWWSSTCVVVSCGWEGGCASGVGGQAGASHRVWYREANSIHGAVSETPASKAEPFTTTDACKSGSDRHETKRGVVMCRGEKHRIRRRSGPRIIVGLQRRG